MNSGQVKVHIGCSGWYYNDWAGVFYPADLPKQQWLDFYARHFSTVEINATFYRLPTEETVKRWFDHTPDDFIFVVKGSQSITHRKRLIAAEGETDILVSRLAPLAGKLKLMLWQLPPYFKFSSASFKVLEKFCGHLTSLGSSGVFEFRDVSWFNSEVASFFTQSGFGYVWTDYAGTAWYKGLTATGPVIYLRMHGVAGDYMSSYSDEQLRELADLVEFGQKNTAVKDIFVFFNNDYAGSSANNAKTLMTLINSRREL